MKELLSNEYFVLGVMSIIICIITELIKKPIKIFTNKIKNENTEKRITVLYMFLPLVFGLVFNFLYNIYYLHIAFSVAQGLSWGTSSIAFYQAVKRVIVGKELTPQEKEQLENVKNLADEIAKDGKIDKTDISAVKDFLNKVK